ncbi:unnamed protein product [Urochloa humidicola]
MLSSLPTCAAFQLKSSGKYLRCTVDAAGEQLLLEPISNDVATPHTRFLVEPSSKHDGLVHIRCGYNNKYWVAQQQGTQPGEWWIAAGADQPEEDLSQPSCTLFQLKPVTDEDPKTIRFYHARLGKNSGIFSDLNRANETNNQAFLRVGDQEEQSAEEFTMLEVFQWLLPKYVCFKGDNGKYLSARSLLSRQRLVYESDDITDPTVRHTTIANTDGTMMIKSDHFDQFWRNTGGDTNTGWIYADSSDTSNDNPNTLFKAFSLGGRSIGLLNLGSNQYCKRLSFSNLPNGLSPNGSRLDVHSRIEMEEPVLSREISNVQFMTQQAIIYGERDLILATASATNDTSSLMPREKLTLDYTVRETWGWYSMVTLRSPVRTSINSPMLNIQDGRLVVSQRFFTGLISWGSINEKSSKVTEDYLVDVPPMTKVTVTCRAKMSLYDVPFSYQQTDKMIDGEVVILPYDDGMYSGRSIHNIQFETEEEKIDLL